MSSRDKRIFGSELRAFPPFVVYVSLTANAVVSFFGLVVVANIAVIVTVHFLVDGAIDTIILNSMFFLSLRLSLMLPVMVSFKKSALLLPLILVLLLVRLRCWSRFCT